MSGAPGAPLAIGEMSPVALVLSDETVFWATAGAGAATGTIRSVAKSGGTPTTLVEGVASPRRIATDGAFVYWTEQGSGGATGALKRISRAGGKSDTLADKQVAPTGVAVDAHAVYWADHGDDACGAGVIRAWFKAMAHPTVDMATGLCSPADVAISGRSVLWTQKSQLSGVAVEQLDIAAGGENPQPGDPGTQLATRIVAHGYETAYAGISDDGKWAVRYTGALATSPVVAVEATEITSFDIDGAWVYWVTASSGGVRALPLALPADAVSLPISDPGAALVAVDQETIFWMSIAADGTGTLRRRAACSPTSSHCDP